MHRLTRRGSLPISQPSPPLLSEEESHRGSKSRIRRSTATSFKSFSIIRILWPLLLVVFVIITSYMNFIFFPGISNEINEISSNSANTTVDSTSARQCTPDQLLVIKRQLPPDDCVKYRREPWTQRCSLSYATRCPDAVWLEKQYTKIHFTSGSNIGRLPPPFLAVFVGCNKGFDALNALRMGSSNPAFDKSLWNDAMTEHGKLSLHRDVCNEVTRPQFDLPMEGRITAPSASSSSLFSQVHCIEPMPATARALQRAAHETKYDSMGFIVSHAALSNEDGFVSFAAEGVVGVENKGIGNTNCESDPNNCINVTKYSLDSYMEKFVPTKDNSNLPINYLSVDVEGWDFEVLLGGKRNLARVHYLEFEYNWVGPWKNQPLFDVIQILDAQFGFTCYWAGFNNTIWRITNCWLDHYESHFWSNIACVNRNIHEVNALADDMEDLFMQTLEKGEDAVRDYEHRFRRGDE